MHREVILCKNAGFCAGVKMAVEKAFEAAEKEQKPVYVSGPLVHNPHVVNELEKKGVRELKGMDANIGTLLIRTHGIHPGELEKLQKLGMKIIDLTCPFVKALQNRARELQSEGYKVVILGESDHIEVKGVAGAIGDNAIVVESAEEAEKLEYCDRIGLVSQTTQKPETLADVAAVLTKKCRELKVFNTICNTTRMKQEAAAELARQVDCMIVVGGRSSANTARLAQICGNLTETHWIEGKSELKSSWFEGKDKIGVVGGASTPDWVLEEVTTAIRKLD